MNTCFTFGQWISFSKLCLTLITDNMFDSYAEGKTRSHGPMLSQALCITLYDGLSLLASSRVLRRPFALEKDASCHGEHAISIMTCMHLIMIMKVHIVPHSSSHSPFPLGSLYSNKYPLL